VTLAAPRCWGCACPQPSVRLGTDGNSAELTNRRVQVQPDLLHVARPQGPRISISGPGVAVQLRHQVPASQSLGRGCLEKPWGRRVRGFAIVENICFGSARAERVGL